MPIYEFIYCFVFIDLHNIHVVSSFIFFFDPRPMVVSSFEKKKFEIKIISIGSDHRVQNRIKEEKITNSLLFGCLINIYRIPFVNIRHSWAWCILAWSFHCLCTLAFWNFCVQSFFSVYSLHAPCFYRFLRITFFSYVSEFFCFVDLFKQNQ